MVESLKQGRVRAFYTFEPEYLSQPETAACHLQFIIDSLKELAQELHALRIPFTVFNQSIEDTLTGIQSEYHFSTLWSHEETGAGWSYRRDKE